MADQEFPHLSLIQRVHGKAKLEGGGAKGGRVLANEQNRSAHSSYLSGQFQKFSDYAAKSKHSREEANLPEIAGGIPFVLQIPDEDDAVLEWLSNTLKLELVAEYEDGYVIVATEDTDLKELIRLANAFIQSEHGSGKMASILEVYPDPLDDNRIKRILGTELYSHWPFVDAQNYLLDVSVEVAPMNRPPATPPKNNPKWKPETATRKRAEYDQKCQGYWQAWDEMKDQREDEIIQLINHYNGTIHQMTHDDLLEFPDSFSVRIEMIGKGFTDLIKTHPSLFEVSIPDEIEQPHQSPLNLGSDQGGFELRSPVESAPAICIIDSGIQEQHRWLDAAISIDDSLCFIPGEKSDDVADYVQGGGHGTRVASACLYPQEVPKSGEYQAPFWLLNARVLDDSNGLRSSMFPSELLSLIVSRYSEQTALYQHSINGDTPCRTNRMSIWATAIDYLSYQEDVLFFQSAGNLPDLGSLINPSVSDHLRLNHNYPEYLEQASSRIANPAQSLQALTVGSISRDFYNDGLKHSITPSEHPSAFTRSGFGLWNSIKPEVVEFGGDFLKDSGVQPSLSVAPEVCPELARSTLYGGPSIACDAVGTSFATPKVAHIGGLLAGQFPGRSPLLYRALIINSTRWPKWAEAGNEAEQLHAIRTMGYGIPSVDRATQNNDYRVTLIPDQEYELKAGEGQIFAVPIPKAVRSPGGDYPVRIDVTLSYAAEPRRTRKSKRGYLGVWLDWKSSNKSESFDSFKARTIKDMSSDDLPSDKNFNWTLAGQKNHGAIKETSRGNGTAQKDWTVARSYELPDAFGLVVRAHKGWDSKNSEATARFSLVVSFEVMGAEVKLYEEVELAVQAELELISQVKIRN